MRHGGFLGERDLFPQAVRVNARGVSAGADIRERAGLTRATFANYFNYIMLQLEFRHWWPSRRSNGATTCPCLRKWKNKPSATNEYHVTFKLNATNCGGPQERMRVFFVELRVDKDTLWEPSAETHSGGALLLLRWASNEY